MAWKFRDHFNFAIILAKIAFHGILISQLQQKFDFKISLKRWMFNMLYKNVQAA